MKTNYLRVVQEKLQEASEAFAKIPFSDSAEDVTLFAAIAKAQLEAVKLNSEPQDGTSLKEYCESVITERQDS